MRGITPAATETITVGLMDLQRRSGRTNAIDLILFADVLLVVLLYIFLFSVMRTVCVGIGLGSHAASSKTEHVVR